METLLELERKSPALAQVRAPMWTPSSYAQIGG